MGPLSFDDRTSGERIIIIEIRVEKVCKIVIIFIYTCFVTKYKLQYPRDINIYIKIPESCIYYKTPNIHITDGRL